MGAAPNSTTWTYVQLIVIDGERQLRPTHLCSTEITFAEAPQLKSNRITIITRNGDRETIRSARVLTHAKAARTIPIELHEANDIQKAPTKLTA